MAQIDPIPSHVLALPCALTDEYHGHRRIGDEAVADVGPDGIDRELRVDVAVVDRLVDDVLPEILLEDAPVFPVQLIVEAQEHLVSRCWHGVPMFGCPSGASPRSQMARRACVTLTVSLCDAKSDS